jgi:hypothetical protein
LQASDDSSLLVGEENRGEPEAALEAEREAFDRLQTAMSAWSRDPSPNALAELAEALSSYRTAVEHVGPEIDTEAE